MAIHEDFMEAEGEGSLLYLEDLFEKKGPWHHFVVAFHYLVAT